MSTPIRHPLRARGSLAAAAFATAPLVLLATIASPIAALAGGAIVPDAACATEGDFKSLAGETTAALTVINNSDETVQTWWLNYDGDRVLYENVAPRSSYVQATWLTHPWVVSSDAGECYRFLVITAREQTVTVAPANPDPAATVANVPTRTPPINAPTAGPTVGPATTPGPTGTASGGGTDWTWPLILGVTASIAAVLIAKAFASGRLPWINRGGPPRP